MIFMAAIDLDNKYTNYFLKKSPAARGIGAGEYTDTRFFFAPDKKTKVMKNKVVPLFVPKCLYRVKVCGFFCRIPPEEYSGESAYRK